MNYLIIGGSSSGKSNFAEDFLSKKTNSENKIYIATMEKNIDENLKKIKKHQLSRRNKGFFTIEQSQLVDKAFINYIESNKVDTDYLTENKTIEDKLRIEHKTENKTIEDKLRIEHKTENRTINDKSRKYNVLLESISNLLSNEMFDLKMGWLDFDYKIIDDDIVVKLSNHIVEEVLCIAKQCENCVIVSDNIFESGNIYDELTQKYIEILGNINVQLAEIVDSVFEVTEGMVLQIK
ncbi:bifunctional adenosylcobinamide kinase/adenosylcobinamide-phosphate guanylyltransferase [Lachnobacterium bovis]|uniref:Adenosylcobinamide kinase n=1 Tax=Lachnobacterium bovis TaxID=140626 RepID=A0A1H9Q9T9_9FIRM|nr:bifunctional adenosylcobinamide kinase/adenosylcobinamide-phosphate guanylyltransferase [Lachnobacterium bovis]SER57281.1 adenosylcobinamide kinase /adenosylcobinamide-phosphate guanylyltransferase [Lachnobacterium bovis]